MQTEKISILLENAKSEDASTEALLRKLEFLNSKKLWHEFSQSLMTLLYQHRHFECQQLIWSVIQQQNINLDIYLVIELLDIFLVREQNLDFDQKINLICKCDNFVKGRDTAKLYLDIIESKHRLLGKDFEKAFNIFSRVEQELNNLREFPKAIFSSLNQAKAIYFWNKQDLKNYYLAQMKFLAYTDKNKMTEEQKLNITERVIQVSLICDSILNFGEIIQDNFLNKIQENQNKQSLWNLVKIFDEANVQKLDEFLKTQNSFFQQYPILDHNRNKLQQKIRVVSLYDCVFYQDNKRTVSFQEISNITGINKFQVERLLIHVLSINLIEGYINEPQEQFVIKSLQPKNLGLKRVEQLKENFEQWKQRITKTQEFINSCQLILIYQQTKMEKIAIWILALINVIACKGDKTEFEKPIMYGVTIGFIVLGVVTIGWIYGLNYERDPLVYSKFLSVRKNK